MQSNPAQSRHLSQLKLYRYRCQNSSCRSVFVPQVDDQEWWLREDEELAFVTCTKCRAKLDLKWYWQFTYIAGDLTGISRLIQILKYAEKVLVGHSELRAIMCENAAYMAFLSLKGKP